MPRFGYKRYVSVACLFMKMASVCYVRHAGIALLLTAAFCDRQLRPIRIFLLSRELALLSPPPPGRRYLINFSRQTFILEQQNVSSAACEE